MKTFTSILIIGLVFVLSGCQESTPSDRSIVLIPDSNELATVTNEPEIEVDQDITEAVEPEEALISDTEEAVIVSPDMLNATTTVFLVEQKPADVSNIHGGLRRRVTYLREPIIIDDVEYKHGFATHTPTNGIGKITYNINKEYTLFHTKLGVTSHGDVIFGIYGDDTQLYLSSPVSQTNNGIEVTVDVKDVDVLTLTVDKVKRNFGDHAVWCDPVLIK